MNKYLEEEDIQFLLLTKDEAIDKINKRKNKNMMHLYRLLEEGKELLTTGVITFPRPDAEELLAIRRGKYSYDELMNIIGSDVDTYFKSFEDKIVLPHSPNRKEADKLCQKLIKERIK